MASGRHLGGNGSCSIHAVIDRGFRFASSGGNFLPFFRHGIGNLSAHRSWICQLPHSAADVAPPSPVNVRLRTLGEVVHDGPVLRFDRPSEGTGIGSLFERIARAASSTAAGLGSAGKQGRLLSLWAPRPPLGTAMEGEFTTPMKGALPGLPPESYKARFLLLSPLAGRSAATRTVSSPPAPTNAAASQSSRESLPSPPKTLKGAVVILAGTGDHGFALRCWNLAVPLLRSGVTSLVLENALYGRRRPSYQTGAKLSTVEELLVLGRATIEEARSLLQWAGAELGAAQLGVTGCSMGGLHAAMAASLMPFPVATMAAFSPVSASQPFVQGLLKYSTAGSVSSEELAAALSLTDIRKFPRTRQPAVLLCGRYDQYVMPTETAALWQRHWPWLDVRWSDAGHVTGIFFRRGEVLRGMLDALDGLNDQLYRSPPNTGRQAPLHL